MNTQPQDIAWRFILTDLPRDPRAVYAGTVGIGKTTRSTVHIMDQIQYLRPINQKRDSEEIQLLKKLVAQQGGGKAQLSTPHVPSGPTFPDYKLPIPTHIKAV